MRRHMIFAFANLQFLLTCLFWYLFRYTEDTEGFTENRESTKSIYSFSLSVLCANSVISVSGLNRYDSRMS